MKMLWRSLLLILCLCFGEVRSCSDISQCQTITIKVTTTQINVTGLAEEFYLQNISSSDGIVTQASDGILNNTSLMSFMPGTQYVIYYGDDSTSCCRNVTTKPKPVSSFSSTVSTSYSVSLTWSNLDFNNASYIYRIHTVVPSSSPVIYDTITTSASATIMNLSPLELYTFVIYTRAADNVTESAPVSLDTCTIPEIAIVLNNYKSIDTLEVTWTQPAENLYYLLVLTGALYSVKYTGANTIDFTGLLPGREYAVTIESFGMFCSRIFSPATEATYPTPPRNLAINPVTTNSLTLSWMEPVNMTGVDKSYNISYGNSSGTWTVTSNTTSVTLQNLTSGTNYTITVVTVGVRGYQSSAVSTSVYTKPMLVKSLQISNVTSSSSVSLTWSKPDEYKTSYSYRVQTNVSSSATMLYNTIVTSESATIMALTPGETYTFLVYTRASDTITESDPVSYTTCTVPGQVSSISLNNYKSVDSLGVSWTKPSGNVTNYTVSVTGAVTNTTQTTATQVTITGLLPGREYTVTVQTNSRTCSQISAPVTQATYPTKPGNITFNTIATKYVTLSWMEPVNMTSVDKSYNISYGNSSGTWTVTSNTTSISLQNLTSGTNYTIAVVTVGVRGYQSSAVSTSVYTKPMSVKSLQISNVTSSSVSLTWSKPDEYKTSYSYRVQTKVSSSATMLYNTIVTSESATIMALTPGETYTFLVYTRAADTITESDPVSYTTCTVTGQVSSISMNNYKSVDSLGVSWIKPSGKVDNYTVSLTGAVTNTTHTTATQVTITGLLPGREYTVTVQTNSGTCSQISAPVTQATYPTPPRILSTNTVGTNSLTLSWMEPVNMAGVNKSYNISYGNSSGTWTVTSNTTSISLQDLTSGTNYTITVVTVGVRGYQSSAVSTSVYTNCDFYWDTLSQKQ
ncbi:receptor-type tyrosine-protein phosphatase eta-like [Engystomops pustulosus]|uniref:receptor-type tyrosine-protein phosphatase eta-like n=1 Tax=Engystomops pustulosus TaxID=76066 RepID=UPI003AFAE113